MNSLALADSGFWLGLLNQSDPYHLACLEVYTNLNNRGIKIYKPWPTMYEVWNSRMVKRLNRFNLDHVLSAIDQDYLIDHNQVLEKLTSELADYRLGLPRQHSLVDAAINLILTNSDLKFKYLITNNRGDFEKTVSKLRGLEIIDLRQPA